jgi:competence protein ComEC
MRTVYLFLLLVLSAPGVRAAQTFDVYFVDVEGGQATLFVSPTGESMLVDTGWPDANGRDANRIAEVAKLAGVKKIDYVVITHYHMDHVGGVPQLVDRIPVGTFIDHGESVEHGKDADQLVAAYHTALAKASGHLVAKPGDDIPITGIRVHVLTAAGQEISAPLPGAGQSNPLCATTPHHEVDTSENAQSIGMLITYGKFRMVDLGDLTWNKELQLVCPSNKIGTINFYLTTHHGMNLSGSAAIVHALHPQVAVMNNGARKGGSPEAWQAVHTSPDLEGFWQLHYAEGGGKANNVPDEFIANLKETPHAHYIKLSVQEDGDFTVTNSRNGLANTYHAR